MNFSESEVLKKEKNLLSHKRKFMNRIRLDAFFINLFIALGLVLVACFGVAGALRGIFDSAPFVGEKELLSSAYTTTVYDKDGNEIQKLDGSGSRQTYVTINQISDAVKNAFIATEDARFYEHHGIDIRGVLTSFYADNTGGNGQDNSTLTQKLLRNQVFENQNSTSFLGKLCQQIQEKYMAVKLEEELGKEKILEYYLNTVSFGENLLGIQEAALYYFDKNALNLTNSEAAVLAAMAQDPKLYEPVKQQAANATQRGLVLENMLNIGCISEDEYEDALGDDVYIELQRAEEKEWGKSEANSYYVDAVISQVISDLKEKAGYSQTRAYHAVYNSGLKIYTCQDKEIQQICDEQIEQGYDQQISFVLMDQNTGRVKALVGGCGEDGVQIDRNRAIDYIREPGNVLSILSTWLPALDTAGMTLGSVTDDSAYEYVEGGQVQKEKRSFGYHGLVTMRESILKSIRIPAIKTLEQIDVQTGYDYLYNLGISTLVAKKENLDGTVDTDIDLSMASGKLIRGVSNLELTAAYATVANGGKYRKPVFYTKIIDRDGNVLLENEPEEKTVIKESTAWLLTNVMIEMVSEGAAKEAALSNQNIPAAGATGVSSSKSDYWFEGYTPYYTAGIWCGNDDMSKQKKESSYLKIWKNIMDKVHNTKNLSSESFVMPSDIVECKICTKCGNLAIEGLCEQAVGGDASRMEYFVRGTEPKKSCDCHVKYYICKESGKPINENCPKKDIESKVFLMKEEMQDTKDTSYVVSKDFSENTCDVH